MKIIFRPTEYSINDFLAWARQGGLELSPKFQRRRVWSEKAKSYLLDTIVRGLPMPPVFIREKIDLATRKTTREVIDGQQRLSAILDFLNDGFKILKTHNEEIGGIYFSQLPEDIQREFLTYQITVNIVQTMDDRDILGIFARLNSYTVPLNKTELLNAKYFGRFKQLVHDLAHEHYTFWIERKILSDNKIVRMGDVELVSELVIASLDGIKGKKQKEIEIYYRKYDDEFDQGVNIKNRFRECITAIDNIYGDRLPDSRFHGIPLFYSLYCLVYDLIYGLPNSENQKRIGTSSYPKIKNALEDLESILGEYDNSKSMEIPDDIKKFKEDYTRHTTIKDIRKRRHNFLLNFINKYL
ncbi:MAG: DUF262 domain-containing protein [candidate division WOR-3 bacterium]